MDVVKKSYIQLHIAVLLFGFTAILGDLIALPAILIVWWRVLITSLSMLFFVNIVLKLRSLSWRKIGYIGMIGVIVGLHWVTFYGAIKLSNASVAVVCMATTAFFTTFTEAIINGAKIKRLDLIMATIVIPFMVLIFYNVPVHMTDGLLVGIVSALLAALFTTLNKHVVNEVDSYTITFVELGSAFLFLSLLMMLGVFDVDYDQIWPPSINDWIYLLALALLCTTMAFILSLKALRHISAFASNLVINLEPVYGVILAALILNDHEQLTPSFYIGGLGIVAVVFGYPFLKNKYKG